MEKIININYQGSVFAIEENAYQQFTQYEQELLSYLQKEPDADEVFKDLQIRMSEILSAKLVGDKTFLTSADITDVIGVIGHPKDLHQAEEEALAGSITATTAATTTTEAPKLRRNSNDKMLSGLCSGLGNYFGLDPVAVRLLFAILAIVSFPLGLVLYLLGFLIPAAPLPQNIGRKLFRNPRNKVLGGVCGGLGSFFNKEPWIFRLIFLLPVLVQIFGGDFFENWLGGSLIGSALITYILLWIITPKARSTADLMLLQGQGLNLRNYNQPKDLNLQPSTNNGVNKVLRVLAIIFLAFCLMIFIPIAFGVVVGGVFVHKFAALVLANNFMQAMYWIALICFFALPIVALIIWLIRRLMGVKRNPRLKMFFGALFALGLVATIILGSNLFKEMNTLNQVESTMPITPIGDTLYVKDMSADSSINSSVVFSFNDLEDLIVEKETGVDVHAVRIRREPTTDSIFSVTIKKYSLGSNKKNAYTNAANIPYTTFFDNQQSLYLPTALTLQKGQPYRGQNIEVTIHVPEGKTVVMDPAVQRMRHLNFGGNSWGPNVHISKTVNGSTWTNQNGTWEDANGIDTNELMDEVGDVLAEGEDALRDAQEVLKVAEQEMKEAMRQQNNELREQQKEMLERQREMEQIMKERVEALKERQQELEDRKKSSR